MEEASRDACDAESDAVDGMILKSRQDVQMELVGVSEKQCLAFPDSLMGMRIPTKPRSAQRMRPRDVRKDGFIASLVKKKPQSQGRRRSDRTQQVTVDTQEEHEVAEALFCLANIKMADLKADVRSLTELHLRSTSAPTRKRTQRTRKGISKRKPFPKKGLHDDASVSSGSGERVIRTRTRSRTRICNPPFQTMFREGGRRVYHSLLKPSEQQPVRRHVIHQPSTRTRQKPQPVRVESTTAERSTLNGRFSVEEDRASVPDERYLPVAVMDALKGIYGQGLICTNNDEPRNPSPTPIKTTNTDHPTVPSVQLKCDERSNASELGTPIVVSQSNNARHIFGAHWIHSHLEKAKLETSYVHQALSSQSRIEDVLKNMPVPPARDERTEAARQFYPSLPMPSTFSHFSMSLPSLPQSLIQTLQNSASHMAPIPLRFPPLSGHPPPLVRASEPWESNQ